MIGVLLLHDLDKIAISYSLAGLCLSLIMFMNGMFLAGAVCAISSVGGGIAIILFGGVFREK